MKHSSPLTYARAKHMRHEPTDSERRLWNGLRNNTLGGLKFYRQVPIGPYIVDFICHTYGVVVELDGATHGDDAAIARDAMRTGYLEALGLAVHRVLSGEIYRDPDSVMDGIYRFVMEQPLKPPEDRKWIPRGRQGTSSGASRHLPQRGRA